MKKCPYCSAEIEDNSRFCLYCMTSLDTKKVINASKISTKRWHIFIAAFLVVAIFAMLVLVSGEKGPASASNLESSRNETSLYTQTESQLSSELAHSSDTSGVQSSQSSGAASESTSTSSKDSHGTSTSSKDSHGTSTSSKDSPSTSTSSKNSSAASTSSKNPSAASTSSNNSSALVSTSSEESTSTSSDDTVSTRPETTIPYCTYSLTSSGAVLLSASNVNGEVAIPNSLGGYPLTAIGTGALNGCNLITGITLPSSVSEIGLAAFRKCSALKSINIPEGVTVLNNSAFSDCSSLESITLPRSLTTIGKNAFLGCDSLTTIYFSGSKLQKENLIIESGNDALSTANWQYIY